MGQQTESAPDKQSDESGQSCSSDCGHFRYGNGVRFIEVSTPLIPTLFSLIVSTIFPSFLKLVVYLAFCFVFSCKQSTILWIAGVHARSGGALAGRVGTLLEVCRRCPAIRACCAWAALRPVNACTSVLVLVLSSLA